MCETLLASITKYIAAALFLAVTVQASSVEVNIRVDAASRDAGKLRPLHGICNYAPITFTRAPGDDLLGQLNELRIPYSYFHDAPLENSGMDLIDVSRIFPVFSADPEDPANYRFAETDAYLKRVHGAGTKIIFRLGESIELGNQNFRCVPPQDPDKWSDICLHIVRHYNEGWADGFHWNITDWALWEEPNNPNLWNGDFEEYLKLYETFAVKFKTRFPKLRIGGPQTTTLGVKYFERFLDYCVAKSLPLDFVAFTAYFKTVEEFHAGVELRRNMMDERGLDSVPLWVNEWHLCPDWSAYNDPVIKNFERQRIAGNDGAGYAGAVLAALQDMPVERACFYTTCMDCWGLFDARRNPTKTWHVYQAFCQFYNRSVRRIALEADQQVPGFYALGSMTESGHLEIFAGCCVNMPELDVKFTLPEGNWRLRSFNVLDQSRNLEPGRSYEYSLEKGVLRLSKKTPGAAVWCVELEK